MTYVRSLAESERQALKRLARREVGRVSERMRMILLSSRGYSVPQIAAIFECDEATVRHWIERFEAEGVAGLHDRPRSGRPRRVDATARTTLLHLVETSPAGFGYLCGFWTVVTLAAHLASLGLHLGQASLRRVLHELDYRWRRPRHDLPQDPLAAVKMAHVAQRLLQAPHEAVILAADECDLHLLPVLRAMWMRRGQQVRVPTPGSNRKCSIFGALNLMTGEWLYAIQPRRRAVEFIAFLEQAVATYPNRPLLVVLDNASIHKAKPVLAWLVVHPQVELLWLPTYSGHKHNPVEKVWWRLKGYVAANRLYGSLEALVAAAHQFFGSFTPDAALRLAT